MEPVVTSAEPKPIRFKNKQQQQQQKQEPKEEEPSEEVKPILLNQSLGLVGNINIPPDAIQMQPLIVDGNKILEQFQNATLVNFATVMTTNIIEDENHPSPLDQKHDIQAYSTSNLKFEVSAADIEKVQTSANNPAFHTTYSTVPPTSTTYTHSETYTYHNYG